MARRYCDRSNEYSISGAFFKALYRTICVNISVDSRSEPLLDFICINSAGRKHYQFYSFLLFYPLFLKVSRYYILHGNENKNRLASFHRQSGYLEIRKINLLKYKKRKEEKLIVNRFVYAPSGHENMYCHRRCIFSGTILPSLIHFRRPLERQCLLVQGEPARSFLLELKSWNQC